MCYLVTYYLFIYFGLFVHPVGWNAIHVSMICSLLLYCHRQLRPLCAYSIVCAVWLLFTDLFPSFLVEAWFCLHAIVTRNDYRWNGVYSGCQSSRLCTHSCACCVFIMCLFISGFLAETWQSAQKFVCGSVVPQTQKLPPFPLAPWWEPRAIKRSLFLSLE